jgi:drug/metabolite transporter (DMT)-like permease
MADSASHPSRLGEFSIFLSCLFFSITSVTVKYAGSYFSGGFISLARFTIGGLLSLCLVLAIKKSIRIRDPLALLLRGVLGASAMVVAYIAIQMTGSGRAILLANTYPVFVAIFGYLFFREKIQSNNIIGLAFCVAGVLFVFFDHSRYGLTGNLLALGSGVISGMAVHFIKRAREHNDVYVVYLSACIFGAAASSFSASEAVKIQGLNILLPLLIVGIFALAGQLAMAYGYKYTTAVKGSIIGFTEIPLTILLSFFFGEEMKPRFFMGMAVIIFGLLINQNVLRFEKIRRQSVKVTHN